MFRTIYARRVRIITRYNFLHQQYFLSPICRFVKVLNKLFKTELHGQHLAVQTVEAALKHHINDTEPEKALAISFHGSTGTGKNLMVNLIVDALYKKGENSSYVHHYNGHLEFSSKENVAQYQGLKEEIIKHLGSCPRSIFIFNEVDHMPAGMMDALIPFLDYNPRLLNVDPTRAIFIFLSNIGAPLIEEKLMEMWQAGKKREVIELQDFQSLLANSAFDGPGGFQQSQVTRMNFIDYYIPFLPLEEIHVRKCIETALKKQKLKLTNDFKESEIIDEVMAHMTFLPPPHNLYSQSGCKRVDSKVSAIIERSRLTNRFISGDK